MMCPFTSVTLPHAGVLRRLDGPAQVEVEENRFMLPLLEFVLIEVKGLVFFISSLGPEV